MSGVIGITLQGVDDFPQARQSLGARRGEELTMLGAIMGRQLSELEFYYGATAMVLCVGF